MHLKGVPGSLLNRLRRLVGRDADSAPDLPLPLVLSIIRVKSVDLVRGFVRMRCFCFIGPRVVLRGKRGIVFGRGAAIDRDSSVDGYAKDGVTFGVASRIGRGSVVTCTSHVSRYGVGFGLGARSGLGDYSHVGASGGVIIEDDVIAGPYCSFHSQEHVFDMVGEVIRDQGTTEEGILVGRGSWLGSRVTVLDGTYIGEGCVVAAGAVVKGSFPANSVIAGVPARIVKSLG